MNLRLVIIRRSAGRLRGCASTSTIPHFDFRLREAFQENCFLTLVAWVNLGLRCNFKVPLLLPGGRKDLGDFLPVEALCR